MDEIDLDTLTVKQLLVLQVRLLANMATTLESIEAALVVEAADDDGCPHPEEARVNLSSQGDLNHWVCRICKFDNKTDAVMN